MLICKELKLGYGGTKHTKTFHKTKIRLHTELKNFDAYQFLKKLYKPISGNYSEANQKNKSRNNPQNSMNSRWLKKNLVLLYTHT